MTTRYATWMVRAIVAWGWCVCVCVSFAESSGVPEGFRVMGVMDDFRSRTVAWDSWADAKSIRPKLRFNSDGPDGGGSMMAVFPKSGYTAMVAKKGVTIPPGCVGLSIWLKGGSGSGAVSAVFENHRYFPKEEMRSAFSSPMPCPQPGKWQRCILLFENLSRAYGTDDGAFVPQDVTQLNLCAYQQLKSFSFHIGKIEYLERVGGTAKPAAFSANKLVGDTSFETGLGGWQSNAYGPVKESIDANMGHSGRKSLKLPAGAGVCQRGHYRLIDAGKPYVFSFYAKAMREGGTVRAGGALPGWRSLPGESFAVGTEWKRCELKIAPQATAETCYLLLGASGEDVWIDDVQLEQAGDASAYMPSEPISASIATGEPGEIVVDRQRESVAVTMTFYDARAESARNDVVIRWSVLDDRGRAGVTRERKHPAGEGAARSVVDTVPIPCEPGYYIGKVEVVDTQGKVLKSQSYAFGVVSPPRSLPTDESFFGCHYGTIPLPVLRDIGARWTRGNVAFWDQIEPKQGQIDTTALQNSIATAGMLSQSDFGWLGVIPLVGSNPTWARDPKIALLPMAGGEKAKAFGEAVGRTMVPKVRYYEMQNEPDLTMGASVGLTVEQAADRYGDYVESIGEGIDAHGGKVAIDAGPDESLITNNYRFFRRVLARAQHCVSVINVHPYASTRLIGPYGGSLTPENSQLREKLLSTAAFAASYARPKDVWVGEFGWALDVEAAYDSVSARMQADYTSRSIILAKSVPQVKRLIWFTDQGILECIRYEYGLWRSREGLHPLPAALAYANAAGLLDGTQVTATIADTQVKAFAFEGGGRSVVAVWHAESEDRPMQFSAGEWPCRIVNMYGRDISRSVDEKGELCINGSPTFFVADAKNGSQLIDAVRNALKQANPPLDICVALQDAGHLKVWLKNQTDHRLEGRLQVSVPSGAESCVGRGNFAIDASRSAEYVVAMDRPISQQGGSCRIVAQNDVGLNMEATKTIAPQIPCPAKTSASATTKSMGNAGRVSLTRRENIYPADPGVGWKNTDDLSAEIELCWDEKALYIEAAVRDDVHHQPYSDENLWLGDALQLAFDMRNDPRTSEGYDDGCSEWGVARTSSGETVVWRWAGPTGKAIGKTSIVRADVTRSEGRLLYRVTIPWSELTSEPIHKGRIFGLNVVVADNDGHGRNFWAAMSPGVVEMKSPRLFRRVILD